MTKIYSLRMQQKQNLSNWIAKTKFHIYLFLICAKMWTQSRKLKEHYHRFMLPSEYKRRGASLDYDNNINKNIIANKYEWMKIHA